MANRSPFLEFSRKDWRQYRHDMPMPLNEADLAQLRGRNEPTSLKEVEEVYLPIARLLNRYVEATQQLYHVTNEFLGNEEPRVPYIIGVAGSVAVGKSTISRLLQTLLSRWPAHREVAIVTTDGYLYPNKILAERDLMERKGFPESYDVSRLLALLADLKAGKTNLSVPQYSHASYDILPDQYEILVSPDIVIVEGLNVLQVGAASNSDHPQVFVSDYFDFSIYVDADPDVIAKWYLDRFMSFRLQAFDNKELYMNRFTHLSDEEARKMARHYWDSINAKNLAENVAPYKNRARLILAKGEDHMVEKILLRKI